MAVSLGRATARGAWVGAALLGGVQLLTLAWAGLSTAGDALSVRVASESQALGVERLRFALLLLAGVTGAGALVGAGQAALRRFARGDRPAARGWDALWVVGLTVLWTIGRACVTPALLAPSLPWPGAIGWIAAHVPPLCFRLLFAGLALFAIARGLRRTFIPRSGPRSASRTTALLLFLPLAGGNDARTLPARPPLNVLILAADSIRPDHLSALGYARPTTPHLDALLAHGTLFSHTYAALAGTTPSWLSILTGRYPHGHGIRHMFPDRRLRARSLSTLPRLFAQHGYRTSVISDYAGDFFPIFDLGFADQHLPPPLDLRTVFQRELITRSPLALAFFDGLPDSLRPSIFRYLMTDADPQRLAAQVIDRLDDRNAPFFITTFFSTTHVPFASPSPAYRRFASPVYGGAHRFSYNLESLGDLSDADRPLDDADRAQVIGLYDGALSAVDAAVGDILRALHQRGLDDRTLVIFLSDHGENLFEPGQTTLHGKWFRGGDQANRVPLIVRAPGVREGQRLDAPVSLVDVAPTLADWFGWAPLDRAEGRSLAGALRGEPLAPVPVFAETGLWLSGQAEPAGIRYPPLSETLRADPADDHRIVLDARFEDLVVSAKHRALWDGTRKLIYEPAPAGARLQLFDLATDPSQRHDLGEHDPEFPRLRRLLFDWLARDPERELNLRGLVVRRRAG